MKSVFLCSPTNSTMFTSCCEVAICDDQSLCPRCREEVYPGQEATNHQRHVKRWDMAYGPTRRRLAAQKATS
jgi:hypothetical protein